MRSNKRYADNALQRLTKALDNAGFLNDDGTWKRWTGGKVAKAAGSGYQSVYRWRNSMYAGEQPRINEKFLTAIEANIGSVSSKSKWMPPNKETGRFDLSQLPDGAVGYFVVWGKLAKDEDGNSLYLKTAVYDASDTFRPMNKNILRWAVANHPIIDEGIYVEETRAIHRRA